jgi:hypothetical protein
LRAGDATRSVMIAAVRRVALAVLVLALPAVAAAQTYTISPPPYLLAQTNAGTIINNACIWTYTAGTSTPATTYTTSTGVANTNPIRSDSAGRFTAFLSPGSSYKFVYETACTPPSHGTVLKTSDGIGATPSSAATVDVTGTAGESITAGQCVYLSAGDGGKNAGQWYKCDSSATYSSTVNDVGIATINISSAGTGTIRLEGQVTGLTALVSGTRYYVGTSGALTSTVPTNARFLGQADSATSIVLQHVPSATTNQALTSPTFATSVLGPFFTGCGVRLTLTSGTPVTSSDVTAAATIYATPYSTGGFGAGVCAFYDGSATWTTLTFTETSIPLGTLTGSLPYDVFCYNNSGTMACELLAWTNGTTRATALVLQNGILVKTGATTRRYIGTFYTTSTTTTEDSAARRLVSNYYNAVPRSLSKQISTASWTYDTATIRQANGAAGNQIDFVVGVAERPVVAQYLTPLVQDTSADGVLHIVVAGLGLDSTTAFSANGSIQVSPSNVFDPLNGATVPYVSATLPAVGYHFLALLEKGTGTGDTVTWYGGGTYAGNAILQGTVIN